MFFTINKYYGGFSDFNDSSLDFNCNYFDFAKALDHNLHTKLMFTLSQIGINGCILKWMIISYLIKNRELWF